MSTFRRIQSTVACVALCGVIAGCREQPTAPGLPSESLRPMAAREGPLVLGGTILTPGGVLKHGYVAVVRGRIASVSVKAPELDDALLIDTDGIILPGFVDVHNHVPWNVLPRWRPGRTFANRDEWREDPGYVQKARDPFERLSAAHFCDMNAWGELRALVGGTTSIMATQPDACIHGLVRNLDLNSGFYGTSELDREHIINVLGVPPATDLPGREQFVAAAGFFIANPLYEALVIHVAEGIDALSEEEFTFLQSGSLLNPKGVVIHGISLTPSDFAAMAAAGTALVWSPRSNLELYGTTTDVAAALNAGVEVALAPDWAITGSGNMLDELKVADGWSRQHLGGRLSARQLVAMVTSVPAHVAGAEDEVGAITPGLRADLLIIDGEGNDPYRDVVNAAAERIQLVLIDGVPLYGSRSPMQRLWQGSELEAVTVGSSSKLVAPAAGVRVAELAGRL
ncbi:MAG TPA: amidohydrolase family protein, partial [Gemmatimonadales bacterium]|nr:amidohydrolase family protein [Gemmatimonadales bacterium]